MPECIVFCPQNYMIHRFLSKLHIMAILNSILLIIFSLLKCITFSYRASRGLLEEWGHNGSSLPIICYIMHRMAVEDVNQTVCLLLFCTQWQESFKTSVNFTKVNWTFYDFWFLECEYNNQQNGCWGCVSNSLPYPSLHPVTKEFQNYCKFHQGLLMIFCMWIWPLAK